MRYGNATLVMHFWEMHKILCKCGVLLRNTPRYVYFLYFFMAQKLAIRKE